MRYAAPDNAIIVLADPAAGVARHFSLSKGDVIEIKDTAGKSDVFVNGRYIGVPSSIPAGLTPLGPSYPPIVDFEVSGKVSWDEFTRMPGPQIQDDYFAQPKNWADVVFERDGTHGMLNVILNYNTSDERTVRFHLLEYLEVEVKVDDVSEGAEYDRWEFYENAMDEYQLRLRMKVPTTKPRPHDSSPMYWADSVPLIRPTDFQIDIETRPAIPLTRPTSHAMDSMRQLMVTGGLKHSKHWIMESKWTPKPLSDYTDRIRRALASARREGPIHTDQPMKHDQYSLINCYDLDVATRFEGGIESYLNIVPMSEAAGNRYWSPCGDLQLRTILDRFARGLALALNGPGIVPECKRDGLRRDVDFSAITKAISGG